MPDRPVTRPRRSNTGSYPASPCTQVCRLDAQNVCVGCRRTLDEIVAWPAMTADEQRAVLQRLASRG